MLVPDVAADRHSCQSEPENRHHPTQLATTGLGTGPEEICSAIPGPWSQVPPFSAYRNTSRYLIVRAEPLVHFDYRAAFLQPRHRVINGNRGQPRHARQLLDSRGPAGKELLEHRLGHAVIHRRV